MKVRELKELLNKIDENEQPTLNGDGSQAYDFIYVEDVARANILALKSDATDEFYNVGSGVQTSIKELCDTILRLKNCNLEIKFIPYRDGDDRALVKNRIGSIDKAKKEIGFEFKYSLEEGLNKLIEWRDLGNR